MKGKVKYIEYSCFTVLYGTSLFAYSNNMIDMFIVSKWCYTLLVLSASIFIIITTRFYTHLDYEHDKRQNVEILCYIIVFITFFQAIYGLGQWLHWFSSYGNYRVTGSFDNPAGFAASLIAGFPFVLYCRKSLRIIGIQYIISSVLLLITLAIILSGSRSGLTTLIVMNGWLLYKKYSMKPSLKLLLTMIVLIPIMTGIYFLKKDSADGRLLIWRCSWNMIKDNFLTGWGWNAFQTYYMDYQADYFECNQNSSYAILADNVQSPFNEYLSIFLCFGFIGILCLGTAMFLLFRFCQYNNLNPIKQTAANALLGIAVFSFFSYPFTYPSIWILIIFCIYILIKDSLIYVPFNKMGRTHYFFIILCTIFLGSKVVQRIRAEYEWKKIAYSTTKNDLSTYLYLYPILGKDPYFL